MRSIAIRYGLIMFAGFIIYFLVMHLTNRSQYYDYRIFNALIQLTCIVMAMLAYKKACPNEFGKLSGISIGVLTSVVGVLPFALFQFLFLALSPEFMAELQESVPSFSDHPESNLIFSSKSTEYFVEVSRKIARYLTPFTAAVIIIMEGLAASLVLSYLTMRFLFMRK